MEPIRPDEDELRAASAEYSVDQSKGKARNKSPKPKKDGKKPGSGGSLFVLILLLFGALAGFGWFHQEQRIAQLEGQLEEADDWARQSKLALARFEGEISETGENLEVTGQSIEERLSSQGKRLETIDSEIAKLWGVANDRNKKRLNEHEARLDESAKARQEAAAERSALSDSVAQARQSLEKQMASLESGLEAQLAEQGEAVSDVGQRLSAIENEIASVDEQVEKQLVRFEREQNLTMDGLESRIASLEQSTRSLSGSQVKALEQELSSLKQTVSSIDASRAQLTSRLIRLTDQVDQMRASSGNAQ